MVKTWDLLGLDHVWLVPTSGINRVGVKIKFIWIPAHIGVEGNEIADKYAKTATKKSEIDMVISYSKAEVKSIIKEEMKKKWQEEWNKETKARMYYSIQKKVGGMRENNMNKREEDIISRMRFGHTGLNSTLKLNRETRNWDVWGL